MSMSTAENFFFFSHSTQLTDLRPVQHHVGIINQRNVRINTVSYLQIDCWYSAIYTMSTSAYKCFITYALFVWCTDKADIFFFFLCVLRGLNSFFFFSPPTVHSKGSINNLTLPGIISNNLKASGIKGEARVSAFNGQRAEKKWLKYLTAQRTRKRQWTWRV